jgi:autotransporter-associated beta strand protein
LRIAALLAGVSLSAVAAHAQNATWGNFGDDWNTASSWTPNTVPTNTATFGASTSQNVLFAEFQAPVTTSINQILFNADAPGYSFFIYSGQTLNINGTGIVNNSSSVQSFSNQGTLMFNSGTAGNAQIETGGITASGGNASGLTAFLNTSTGGTARFITDVSSVFDMSGLTSGGMTAGSIEGAGSYYLGSKTLTVGGNNLSTTVSGVISDCGPTGTQCIKSGATGGSLTFTGGNGASFLTLTGVNTYTGATNINGGALEVDGSIARSSLTTVNGGGVLSGTGQVGNTQINNAGTLLPGHINQSDINHSTPGTLSIMGNLALGGTYYVIVNSSGAGFTNVTGTASLSGGSVIAFINPGSVIQTYDILHAAGGLKGTFTGILFNELPPPTQSFTASLSYAPNDVFMKITARLGGVGGPGAGAPGVGAPGEGAPGTSGPSVPVGLSQNEASVAAAINNFFNNGGTLPPGFANLFFLTGGNLTNALTLLSGEAATGAQQGAFQLMTEFMGLMLDPFVDGRAGVGGAYGYALPFAPDREPLPEDIALAYSKVLRTPVYKATPFEQRWSVWGAGYGGYNTTSGDPLLTGSHDLSAHTAGGAAGLDYRIAPGTVVGFALAGGGTGWSLAQGLGGGRSDAFQAGVYGTTRAGPVYLAAALAFTEHWMSTDRYAFAGDYLTANFNAQSFGGRVETGYRIPTAVVALTPYAAVQVQNFHTPTYSEADVSGGGFGLTYDARNATDTRSELGARFDRQMLLNWNAVLALRGKVAWAHDWVSDPSLITTFEALPGASFIVNGATPAKNSALTSAGAELRLINGVSVLAKFDGEFASHSQTYGGTGTVRYMW